MVVLILQKGFIPLHFKRPETFLEELWVNLFYGLNITLGISKIVQHVFAPSSGTQRWSEIIYFADFTSNSVLVLFIWFHRKVSRKTV